MNSPHLEQVKFQGKLKKFSLLPGNSEEKKVLYPQILSAVQYCLEVNATEKVKAFFVSRYVCPIHYIPEQEDNFTKLSKVAVSALGEPGLLKNICFSSTIGSPLQQELLSVIGKALTPKVSYSYRELGGRGYIEFTANF